MIDFGCIRRDSIVGRLLRAPLRLLPSTLRVPILQGYLRGKWWIVGSATHGCWLGSYELKKQCRFVELVKRNTVVYDIGANVGFYSLLAGVYAGSSGRVVAFEPSPRNLAFLRAHIEINGLFNVVIHPVAVSNTVCEQRFDESDDPSQSHLSADGKHVVQCVTIDSLVISGIIPPPNVLKIDVEGAELSVLDGADETIGLYKPIIFLATHSPDIHTACCSWLQDRGFTLGSLDSAPVMETRELVAVFQT